MTTLERRTLRSGKEFSAFDLAAGPPVSPPQYFSVADCLKQRLEAQQITQIFDEPAEITYHSPPQSPSPPPSPLLSGRPSPTVFALLPGSRDPQAKRPSTTMDAKKLGSMMSLAQSHPSNFSFC
ncbi:hypothetical protein C8R45DRAFT_935709 [Mycena sanguinolenta]|nr:hypothetical protein C8R45DRAFT_935709 [Mycena sanguinolenta]